MKNKKGFTLIELLAVIVILAILATASFTLVLPQIEKARKKSFVSEAANIIEAAEVYFANNISNDKVRCVKIEGLKAQGLLKNPKGKFGAVYYVPETIKNASGTVVAAGGTFKISLSNSSFMTAGSGWVTVDELRSNDGTPSDKVVKADSFSAPANIAINGTTYTCKTS